MGVMFNHAVMDADELAAAGALLKLLADRTRTGTILGYAGAAAASGRPA